MRDADIVCCMATALGHGLGFMIVTEVEKSSTRTAVLHLFLIVTEVEKSSTCTAIWFLRVLFHRLLLDEMSVTKSTLVVCAASELCPLQPCLPISLPRSKTRAKSFADD